MKSNKNQSSEPDANVRYVTSSMNRVQQDMPEKESYNVTPFSQNGQEKDLQVRRFSFDNNGGGYAGL